MRSRFTAAAALSLALCALPGCPSRDGGDAPPPTNASGQSSVSLQGGPPGALGGLPGNGLGGIASGNSPGVQAPGNTPPVTPPPGNQPGPGGPGGTPSAAPGAAYGKGTK